MKRTSPLILATLLCALHARAGAQAEIYRCTESDGHVTLTDRPCDHGREQRVRVPMPSGPDTPLATPVAPAVQMAAESLPADTLPAESGEGVGATAAYAPLSAVVQHTAPRPQFVASPRFTTPLSRLPSPPLATDTSTLRQAQRALEVLDGTAKPTPKAARKKKRLFGLFSRKKD